MGRNMRILAILAVALLAGCTATMKYHMAANQVQAATKKDTWWWNQQGTCRSVHAPAADGVDVVAATEDSGCIVSLATESEIEDCAVALSKDASATPSLADARGQIEACLVRKGYERTTFIRLDPIAPPACTDFYPLERCPMPVESKP